MLPPSTWAGCKLGTFNFHLKESKSSRAAFVPTFTTEQKHFQTRYSIPRNTLSILKSDAWNNTSDCISAQIILFLPAIKCTSSVYFSISLLKRFKYCGRESAEKILSPTTGQLLLLMRALMKKKRISGVRGTLMRQTGTLTPQLYHSHLCAINRGEL